MSVPLAVRDSPAAASRRLLCAVLLFVLTGCAFVDPRQRDPAPPGIAEEATLNVDGLSEHLLIRGNDPAHNPVLLFVHGGPGFPGAPFRQVNSDLERYFTVVHWDQRGAGYSYFKNIPADTMRVEQFVRETLLVSHALCRRFGQRKIYLVGHSWGTLPAAMAAAREPQLYHAYVALSQLVDINESEHRITQAAFRQAETGGETKRARQLREIGPPPYRRVPNQATEFRLALLALSSRYYPLDQLFRVQAGYRFSRRLLVPQLPAYDLRKSLPEIDTPVYFFVGREDATFGVSLQYDYSRVLTAPHGKTFVLFRKSTHWPHLEQPAAFLEQMRRVRAETWQFGAGRTPVKIRL